MRVIGSSAAIVALIAATSAWSQAPSRVEPSREASGRSSSRADTDVAGLFRFEPTGLSLLRPYQRGKIPVVFVHGLWANPWSWSRMIESLEADAALRDRYQFWTFGYSTGDPIPYSAALLRRDLEEVRRKFDPDGTDAAFDRMVVVGHSMGGLLTKMMVQDSGTRLWRLISDRPVDELAGEPDDRDLFRRALIFKPRPEVRRVVFIATPHRGSRVDRGGLEHLGSRLVRLPDPLRASHERLMARNGPDFFAERFRKGLPTSIDELEWQSPILMGLDELGLATTIKAHSIIADRRDPPRAGGSDGLVPYESAHLDGTCVRVARVVRPSVPGPSRRDPRGPADPRGAWDPMRSIWQSSRCMNVEESHGTDSGMASGYVAASTVLDRLSDPRSVSPAITMLSWLEFVVGVLIWCGVLWDGFATIILPRTVTPMRRLSGRFYRWSWRLWAAAGRRIRDPESRLSFLAVYGPISIVLLLVLWAGLMIVAFALIYHGLGPRFQAAAGSVGFGTLLYMSGSTFLTLGLGDVTSSDPIGRLFMILEAGTGYIFLALMITYMPVLDQAYGVA